jgi:hypothetical protein
MTELELLNQIADNDKPAARQSGSARGAESLYFRWRGKKTSDRTAQNKARTFWMAGDSEARQWVQRLATEAGFDVEAWAA